jgi:hypothetical protein
VRDLSKSGEIKPAPRAGSCPFVLSFGSPMDPAVAQKLVSALDQGLARRRLKREAAEENGVATLLLPGERGWSDQGRTDTLYRRTDRHRHRTRNPVADCAHGLVLRPLAIALTGLWRGAS